MRLLLVEDVPQVAQYIRGLLNAQDAGQAARRPHRRLEGRSTRSASSGRTSLIVDALLQGRVKGLQLVEQLRAGRHRRARSSS